jgi:hypothetical protein
MKKLALIVALAATSLSAMAAQSAITAETFTANKPIYWLASGTLAPDNNGIFVQVLGGPIGGALAPLTDALNSPITMSMGEGGAGPGFIFGNPSLIPGTDGSANVQLQVIAWKGAATFAAAPYQGQSAVWTQNDASSWTTATPPPAIAANAYLNMPASFTITAAVVPEPSTIALGLLGAATLLLRRRS